MPRGPPHAPGPGIHARSDSRRGRRGVRPCSRSIRSISRSPLSPVGDRRADGEVVLTAPAAQEELEGRQQSHEWCALLAAAESADRLGELWREHQRMQGSSRAPDRRTRAVRRQLQGWHAGEPVPPTIDLALPCSTLELVALPAGEVGILDWRERERGRAAPTIRLVECRPARWRRR